MSDAPPPELPKPKRARGRTGRRRLTAAEALLRGPHAVADHRRRYGTDLPAQAIPMPGPPIWFTTELQTVWTYTLATAPPGLLQAGDYANLVTLCTAVELYARLSRQLAEQTPGPPEAELIQQLRSVGAEVGRAFRVLGLTPPERARIGLPVKSEQEPDSRLGGLRAFPKVVGGKAA